MAATTSRPLTVQDALLRDVLVNPSDDCSRLVLADWLEENGDPDRAEFIRLDIELWNEELSTSRRLEIRRRREELIGDGGPGSNGWRWAGVLTSIPNADFNFKRGFVEHAQMSLGRFAKHAKIIFSSHPVTRVTAEGALFGWVGEVAVWHRGRRSDHSMDGVPARIFDRLRGGKLVEDGRLSRHYRARKWFGGKRKVVEAGMQAVTDLHNAITAHGRHLANLPPLTSRP